MLLPPYLARKPFLTLEEVCGVLNIGRMTFYRMRMRGKGPPTVICGLRTVRIPTRPFIEWLMAQEGF